MFDQYKGLRKEIYVLFIGRMITAMGSMVWSMLTIILSNKLNFSATEISTWLIWFSILMMPISLLGGKLADKYNKKAIILICDVIEVIAYFYCFLVPLSRESILVFMVCSAFENLSGPSYETLIADLSSSADREKANSLLYFGANLGMVMAPTIGGLLVKNHVNLIFFISGITTLIAVIIEFIYLNDLSVIKDDSNKYEQPRDGVSLWKVLRENNIITVFVAISSISSLIYSQYNFLIPLDLTEIFNENGSLIFGILSSVNCLTVILFTVPMTKLFEKLKDLRKYTIATVLYGMGFIIFIVYKSIPLMCYFAIFVFTVGEILATLSHSVFITHRIPATHRGRMLSFASVLGNVVYVVLQRVISLVYDNTGSIAAWSIVLGLNVIVVVSLLVLTGFDKKRYSDLYKK